MFHLWDSATCRVKQRGFGWFDDGGAAWAGLFVSVTSQARLPSPSSAFDICSAQRRFADRVDALVGTDPVIVASGRRVLVRASLHRTAVAESLQ